MAVLVIIVMFLGRAFNDASGAFRRGAITVERNGAVQVALDRIAADLETMIINDRVACALIRNTSDPSPGFGFDEIWFVTSQGLQTDGSAHEFARYYVRTTTNTFAGLQYVTFQLRKDWWYYDTLRDHNVDPFGGDREWWVKVFADTYTPPTWYTGDVVIENIVRFDIWAIGNNGNPINMAIPGYDGGFRSTLDAANYAMGTHPAYFDVYLQATSDDTMRQAGRIYITSPANANMMKQARTQMVRDSNMLFTRVYPVMAAGQRDHPFIYWY